MSKELEALENIKHYDSRVGLHESDYGIIETALKRLEEIDKYLYLNNKQLKALEIVKEHSVNIGGTRGNFEGKKPINEIVIALKDLTQEEFDLLKEVLQNER